MLARVSLASGPSSELCEKKKPQTQVGIKIEREKVCVCVPEVGRARKLSQKHLVEAR